MSTTATARSTRATTKFKYSSHRETGSPKTLVTLRLEDSLLDLLAKEGNVEGLSMSATLRRVIRRGLNLPEAIKPETLKPARVARGPGKTPPTRAVTPRKKTVAPAGVGNIGAARKKKAAAKKKVT